MRDNEISLRKFYGQELVRFGEQDSKILVVDADCQASTGTNLFEQRFPSRFYDVGIREQLLITLGGGLALSGYRVFVSSFSIFLSRGWEPLRQLLGTKTLQMVLVGTHQGITCGEDGKSHQCLEDLSLFRAFSNVRILSPMTRQELRASIHEGISSKPGSVVYIRLPRPSIVEYDPELSDNPTLVPYRVLQEGTDGIIISMGYETLMVIEAQKILRKQRILLKHVHVLEIQPLSPSILDEIPEDLPVFVVEDHHVYGGLASNLSDLIVDHNKNSRDLIRIGMRDFGDTDAYKTLLHRFRLDGQGISDRISDVLKRSQRWRQRNEKKQAAGIVLETHLQNSKYDVIGLGTGSTVDELLDQISKNPSSISESEIIVSSNRTRDRLRASGIRGRFPSDDEKIDFYVDGADWVDEVHGYLIKGYGGAINLERRCIDRARRVVLIVDSSKISDDLSSKIIPIEISKIHLSDALLELERIFGSVVPKVENGVLVRSDLGNLTLLCKDPSARYRDPETMIRTLDHLKIIETHGFLRMDSRFSIVLGYTE